MVQLLLVIATWPHGYCKGEEPPVNCTIGHGGQCGDITRTPCPLNLMLGPHVRPHYAISNIPVLLLPSADAKRWCHKTLKGKVKGVFKMIETDGVAYSSRHVALVERKTHINYEYVEEVAGKADVLRWVHSSLGSCQKAVAQCILMCELD